MRGANSNAHISLFVEKVPYFFNRHTPRGNCKSFSRSQLHFLCTDWLLKNSVNLAASKPGTRTWDDMLSSDPLDFVAHQLADLDALVARSEVDAAEVHPDDARQLREAVPEIMDAVRNVLARVRAGELATAPAVEAGAVARAGWL